MKTHKRFVLVITWLAMGVCFPQFVNADLVFSFGRHGELGLSEFTVQPGTELNLDVFIFEPEGSLLTDMGIGATRFQLALEGEGISHGMLESFQLAPGFRLVGSNTRTDLIRMVDISGEANGFNVDPVFGSSPANAVRLGTTNFIIDPNFNGTVMLSATQLNPIDVSLGSNIFNFTSVAPARATIIAIPEPRASLFLSLILLGGWVLRRKRTPTNSTRNTWRFLPRYQT